MRLVARVGRAAIALVLAAGVLGVTGCGMPGFEDGGSLDGSHGVDATADLGNDAPSADGPVIGACVDHDGDGFGLNCARGPDCDDTNAAITNQCYSCLSHGAGCPCDFGTPAIPCDLVTDTDHPAEGECHLGQRNCGQDGTWGHCVTVGSTRQSTIQIVQPCAGVCDPDCHFGGACPDTNGDLATGTNVVLGGDPAPVFCPSGTNPGGVTLFGGATDPTGGTPVGCVNLCLQQVTCPGGGTTTVTGTVYAPTPATYLPAGGLPDPLYNALVYVPNAPVAAFTPGITCDVCGAPASGSPLVSTVTGYDGTFTLTNVPVGHNIPLVIQLGRWRRQIVIPNVTACSNNVLTPTQTRLPRTQAEGDIPLMAMVTGNVDALECVLRKIGIDDTEFSVPTASGGHGRVQMYIGNGANGPAGGAPSENVLWSSPSTLSNYDLVMMACKGGQYDQTSANQTAVQNYANAGGRVFATHYSYVWLYNDAPFSSTATWNVEQGNPPDPVLATIDQSFPKGSALASWLYLVNASPSAGQIYLSQSRHDFDAVVAPSQDWVYAQRSVSPASSLSGSCATGLNLCSRVCVNEQTSATNCGACGHVCGAGQVCTAGVCTCPGGEATCASTCTYTAEDEANCGTCGTACPSGGGCISGACSCSTGETSCSGTCTVTSTDTNNCGACGNVCATNGACVGGACSCDPGYSTCSGACVNTLANINNCGTCGTRCSGTRVCSLGACVTSCAIGLTSCSRNCVSLLTNPDNCGACGNACANGASCVAGTCVCPLGQTACGGVCVTTATDPNNCGACGRACGAGGACVAGTCTCPAGTTVCSGVCSATATDPTNCGACGNVCPGGEVCSGGACVCPAGTALCGGVCRATGGDVNNCGACGNVCPAGYNCTAGACVNPCPAGQNRCSGTCVNLQTSATNCGACGTVCASGSTCVAGACTVTNYLHYTFNTPVGAAPAAQCGRVVFSDFHVNNLASGSGLRFPAECDNTPMTAQEKILEFMLFDLASCIAPGGSSGPVCAVGSTVCGSVCCPSGESCRTVGTSTECFTPYPASGTYTQDIDASTACAAGSSPQWNSLVFTARIPAGTSIDVQFQTATTSAGLTAATPVLLGTIPTLTSPVDLRAALAAAHMAGTLPYGRVFFTLHSTAARDAAPTLDGYQVNFDCVANF